MTSEYVYDDVRSEALWWMISDPQSVVDFFDCTMKAVSYHNNWLDLNLNLSEKQFDISAHSPSRHPFPEDCLRNTIFCFVTTKH